MRSYYRQFSYFAILLVTVLLLIFLHLRGWSRPVESVISEVPRPIVYVLSETGHSFKSFFSFFSSVSTLNKTNANLENRIRTLEQNNIALQQYKLENDILRKELNYRTSSNLNLISASVVAKDPTGFSQTVILDAGTSSGVRQGDAVLAEGVFVGKIVETDNFTSKALIITDPNSSLDAQISSTGDKGVLQGSYGSGLVINMISQSSQITGGDEVVTAGLTDQIPQGLFIGNIGELQSQKNDLLQKASVVPGVDLKNLTFVSVVKK